MIDYRAAVLHDLANAICSAALGHWVNLEDTLRSLLRKLEDRRSREEAEVYR